MFSIKQCPLCLNWNQSTLFFSDRQRQYWQCSNCALVFVPRYWHLRADQEKAIYDLHQNHFEDTGYRRFLSRLATPVLNSLGSPSQCLDYGCGPTPLLAELLRAQQHQVTLYDPYYACHADALDQRYDAITCSEVVEHFRLPRLEFDRLFGLLKADGLLAIMTKRVIDQTAFARWHYKNDPTHISFFSDGSFRWLAEHYGCAFDFADKDVVLLRRNRLP